MQQQAINFDAPRAAAIAGMTLAADHAEAVSPEWKERAYRALRQYAMTRQRFTAYDFRHAGLIVSPTTDKAFGPIFLKAARAGLIQRVGYDPHPERHGSPTPVWASQIYGMAG